MIERLRLRCCFLFRGDFCFLLFWVDERGTVSESTSSSDSDDNLVKWVRGGKGCIHRNVMNITQARIYADYADTYTDHQDSQRGGVEGVTVAKPDL